MNCADVRYRGKRVTRLLVHVEGQTEENFVNAVLAPHLYSLGYQGVSARLLGNARQRSRRGGIRDWPVVRTDIVNHLKEDQDVLATTMVDYYALPDTWPGRTSARLKASAWERAETIKQAVLDDVSAVMGTGFKRERFIPHVVMHEFEGLLFSSPTHLAQGIGQPALLESIRVIRNSFLTPEDINDSPFTAPSKRIIRLSPNYQKTLMGVQIAQATGLGAIRLECPLLDNWLAELESQVLL